MESGYGSNNYQMEKGMEIESYTSTYMCKYSKANVVLR